MFRRKAKPAAQDTYFDRFADRGFGRTSAVISFNHDGLMIARTRTHRRYLPIWHLMVFIYFVLLIRMVALAEIGPAGYAYRMEEMRNGNVLERVAVQVMQLDPMSRWAAGRIRTFMHKV